MSHKLNGSIFAAMVAAVGMIATAGTASAQSIFGGSIPGTFFAINDDNTQTQEARILGNGLDIGTRFSSDSTQGTEFLFGAVPFWQERATVLSGGNSAGSEFSYSGVFDPAIVTTITGLEANATYEVEFIFLGTRGNGNYQYRTGFEADSTTQILDTFDFSGNGGLVATEYEDVSVSGFINGGLEITGLRAFGSRIGEVTLGDDGVLTVFTDTDQPGSGNLNLSSFAGLSLVQTGSAVPEPSSLALLGLLGGLGLIRRRR